MSLIGQYINQIRFFIKGQETKVLVLLITAVSFGILESLSISLLYPMISVGFNINDQSIPFSGFFDLISSILPFNSKFINLGLIFIIVTLLSFFLQLTYWKIAYIFNREIVVTVKHNLFAHLKSTDYRFFVETKQGDLVNSFNQSPQYINQTFITLMSLCSDLMSSILIIFMLFFLSPGGLSIVLIAGLLFYYVLNRISRKISEQLGRLQIASGQSENIVINEYISGIKAISAANNLSFWEKRYIFAINQYWNKYSDYMFMQKIPILAINSLFYIAIGIIVIVLFILYREEFVTIIPIIGTFSAGMLKIMPKFTNMGDYKLQLKNYQPHIENIYNLLHDLKYQSIHNGNLEFSGLQEDIRLQNISFTYEDKIILDHINLIIQKGLITALIGTSGSGKTTLTNLLLRLYDPTGGRILINGENLQQYEIGSFRDRIGYVGQEPFIYNTTIKENIAFGGDYTDEEIIWASKLAHADHFIQDLPGKYETIVGDRGLKLSGGEKQRIVIARAMIRHPDLLILDEATSSLDNVSEAIVQDAIDNVASECTTLIIAHRLTTIKNADRIYVLERGKIFEDGNHQNLMEKKGKYWEMFTRAHPITDNTPPGNL